MTEKRKREEWDDWTRHVMEDTLYGSEWLMDSLLRQAALVSFSVSQIRREQAELDDDDYPEGFGACLALADKRSFQLIVALRETLDCLYGHDPNEHQINEERARAWSLCARIFCPNSQDDHTCDHPDNTTPECHEWACPMRKEEE